MKEKRDFSLKRKGRELTPETLARILGNTAIPKDAKETYERLTGEKWPGDEEEEHERLKLYRKLEELREELIEMREKSKEKRAE